MFTGIVEELGEVVDLSPGAISIRGPRVTSDASAGDSIAVNGVCLTVVAVEEETFTADVMGETYHRTALDSMKRGDVCNLERSVTPSVRLGGHIVQGHVDGVGQLAWREPASEWETVAFGLPQQLSRYVVEKGSIAVDGVSLTVAAVTDDEFTVGLISTTMKLTTLGHKQVGDPVHLETDIIAKHVERLLEAKS